MILHFTWKILIIHLSHIQKARQDVVYMSQFERCVGTLFSRILYLYTNLCKCHLYLFHIFHRRDPFIIKVFLEERCDPFSHITFFRISSPNSISGGAFEDVRRDNQGVIWRTFCRNSRCNRSVLEFAQERYRSD